MIRLFPKRWHFVPHKRAKLHISLLHNEAKWKFAHFFESQKSPNLIFWTQYFSQKHFWPFWNDSSDLDHCIKILDTQHDPIDHRAKRRVLSMLILREMSWPSYRSSAVFSGPWAFSSAFKLIGGSRFDTTKYGGSGLQNWPRPLIRPLANRSLRTSQFGRGFPNLPIDLYLQMEKRWVVIIKCTMLQKLSKCEVKAVLCGYFTICLPLRFYVKSNFGEFKQPKNVIFDHLETQNFEFL